MRLFRILALGLAVVAGTASAQTYPDKSKPLRVVLPQGPGSVSDVIARALGKAITDTSGMNVVMDYKPGAETVIGVQSLLSAPADGYSMLVVSSSTPVLNVVMLPNLPYDPFRDFIPLAGISKLTLQLNLGSSTQFKTAHEFLAAAKASPGKYTFASSTTSTRLAGELLQTNAGVKLMNVPYKSTSAAVVALASGEVDSFLIDAASVQNLWQTGRVRSVAVSSAARMAAFPNVPTLREEGVRDYDFTAWFAAYFARGTPPEAVAAMRSILGKALKTREFTESLSKVGMEPLDLAGDDLTALARREVDVWTKIVKANDLKPHQ